jgi:translation initiation factor IF-2
MRQMGQASPRPAAGQTPRPGENPPAQGGQPAQGDNQSRDRRPLRPGSQRVGTNYRVTSAPVGQNQQRPAPPSPLNKQPVKPTGPVKLANISPEMLAQMQGAGRDTPITVKEVEDHMRRQSQPARPAAAPATGTPAPGSPLSEFDEDGKRRDASGVAGRADRHKERSERRARRDVPGTDSRGKVSTASLLDDEGPRYRYKDRHKKPKPPGTVSRKGKTPISLPITVRTFSEAIGRKVNEVLFKLMGHGMPPSMNINSGLEPDLAELVALEYGCELEIKRDLDVEQAMLDVHAVVTAPEDLVPRAPIVAVMGHVDHGKTSLLDRIREAYGVKSDVVSTEAGGITQVLRAWRVSKDGKPITFLDTPGHEAFTKMRARGANVTDIAVIVVAANDGVMPQTEEAISHAKAAEVSIVVAINKVDLPDSNLRKTEQQLYSLGLIPDNMGGDVPFVLTSAKTGKGIDELLEQISLVAEFKELSANPSKPASGTCLEAYLSEREGVQATLLVQDGTLRTGDIVLCGASYGTVRRMYDDVGNVTDEAGPSLPVRILGLDHVPNADDTFHVVEELSNAREIAEGRQSLLIQKSQKSATRLTLETLKDAQIVELKIILKAEARGSVEAIRNELEKLHHDEVRVRLLHAAIGGITASDVQLALTSPEDTLIVGFNVVPDSEARALAEEKGIQIKQYDVIYRLAEDIRSALEGKLKPREEIVYLGRANVRNTFRISRVGTIAGCFVTQGVMERSAKIRVVRNGLVVYPPPERTAGLETLKRFKDDVREVREGFECGIKIAGYDDIKVDDAIECYRIEHVKRTLS